MLLFDRWTLILNLFYQISTFQTLFRKIGTVVYLFFLSDPSFCISLSAHQKVVSYLGRHLGITIEALCSLKGKSEIRIWCSTLEAGYLKVKNKVLFNGFVRHTIVSTFFLYLYCFRTSDSHAVLFCIRQESEEVCLFCHFLPFQADFKPRLYQMALIFFKTQSFFFYYNFIKYTWMIHIKKDM